MDRSTTTTRRGRVSSLLIFAGLAAWYFGARVLAASAARGIAVRFGVGAAGTGVLEAAFNLFLLVVGLRVFGEMAGEAGGLRELLALPRRGTAGQEWGRGAALGWGMVMVCLLPVILSGRLHPRLLFTSSSAGSALLTIVALALASLATEMVFRGYPFRCLTMALGQAGAVVTMVVAAGFVAWRDPFAPGSGVLVAMLLALLLSLTWLRTHAVWYAWGLHFALVGCMGVLFGLPAGNAEHLSWVVRGSAYGPDWLTGGAWGPGASAFSVLVLLGAIPLVYRLTREFAWEYTHPPIVAGGYEVMVAAPAAHVAMEQQAARAPALVQILAETPQSFSAGATGAAGQEPGAAFPDRFR